MGADAAPPSNPDNKTNAHHFSSLARQLGIENDDFRAALEAGSLTLWDCRDYSQKWGFLVNPPVQATVQPRPDGMYNVTFQLLAKKKMDPQSFYYPYRDGQRPIKYEGPIEDKTEVMTEEELQDAVSKPLQSGGMPSMGGMGGGMGGPGMGGGMPPLPGGSGGMTAPPDASAGGTPPAPGGI